MPITHTNEMTFLIFLNDSQLFDKYLAEEMKTINDKIAHLKNFIFNGILQYLTV